MIGDGFVLTQHDGLEGKADLSKFWLSRSALPGQLVGRRWSLYDICSNSQRGGLT